jgi:N-acetyl sugar amidotransferase
MPDTKPGVYFDEEGVCSACRSVEQRNFIDWDTRHEEFKQLCDAVRGTNGNGYDCLVPVSGGKDSHYQTWMMKVVHNMNVLCVCIVPHLQTEEGIINLNNLVKVFNVDLIKVSLKPSVFKAIRKKSFFTRGETNWADHCSTFAGVARVAYTYHVPLVVWGEDIAVEFGGTTSKNRVASAEDLIRNDLIKDTTIEYFYNELVNSRNIFFYKHPSKEELHSKKIRSVYLGDYYKWDGYNNYEIAKKYGFQPRKLGTLSGNALDYDNIDEKLCEIHIWFKFLKFGFWRPTDQCCYWIWNGQMSRKEAVEIVNAKQYQFPWEYLDDFLAFHDITEKEFWQNVDKWRNREIWHRVNGRWRLKVPLI